MHGVDLDDVVVRAHALGLVIADDAAVSHTSAARVRGLPVPGAFRDEAVVHVSMPRPRRAPKSAGVAGHSIELPRDRVEHLLVVASGTREHLPVRLVDEPTTLLTCATQLSLPDLVALADAMLQRARSEGRADPMPAALALGVGKPGRTRLAQAAALHRAGVRSRAESLLRLQIVSSGLPDPVVAHVVHSTSRSTESWAAEADLAWPAYGVLLEYEGDMHRSSRRRFTTDVRRFERYADEGWRALRATRDDVFDSPSELLTRLERRLRENGWRPHRRWRRRAVPPAVA